ncbi:MAG: oligopeptide:H+ symporter [Saprospiraceae bacterium]
MVSNTQYTDWFMYFIGPFSIIYLIYEMSKLTKAENKKLIAALVFIVFAVVFWAIFEQAGGSLSIYAAEHLKKDLVGLPIDPNIVNNSSNSLYVIIFAPLFGLLWLALGKKHLEPNSVMKFGIGFLLLGLAFYVFSTNIHFANALAKTSLNIFALGYLIVTFGELSISPIGLSLMTKLAPYKLQGFMMGMWFLASAYGQYVAGLFGASISAPESATPMEKLQTFTDGYQQLAIYAVIAGVILIVLVPVMKNLMGDEK